MLLFIENYKMEQKYHINLFMKFQLLQFSMIQFFEYFNFNQAIKFLNQVMLYNLYNQVKIQIFALINKQRFIKFAAKIKKQMDSENQHSQNQSQQLGFQMAPLPDKYQKVLNLNQQSRAQIEDLTKKSIRKVLLNSHIDPRNQARPYNLNIMRQNIQFQNFMTKKKNQSKRKQAFQIIRQMLQMKGYNNISSIADRQARSIMVVRFVNKVQQQHNVMQIEDEKCKQRQKILIKQGIAWVGLICAIQAVYENQMYRLQKIIDLSQQSINRPINTNQPTVVFNPFNAYRVLMIKGPFWKTDGKQSIGTQMIVNQVEALRYKENMRIDLVIVMGPILSQNNQHVKNFNLQNTFEDQVQQIIQTLKKKLIKVIPDIQVLVLPSTDDITSLYPIPQPTYNFLSKINVKLASNPCTVRLQAGRPQCKLNLINYDLITYIDSSKCGRSIKQPLIQNIQTYLKQPFLLSNTLDDSPFDETNFNSLFNHGQFGNVIVMSSQKHPAFAHKVKGNKVFINIGSMGIDYHMEDKHFMTLMSIFQGQGQLADRIKVESIVM